MKRNAITIAILLTGVLSIKILGITDSVIGQIIILLGLLSGIGFAGFRKNEAMLCFAVSMFTLATKPSSNALAFYLTIGAGIFCLWAWARNKRNEA